MGSSISALSPKLLHPPLTIKVQSLSSTFSTGRTEVLVSSAGVTRAVHHSDLVTCQWVGADKGRGRCAHGPWFWDWQLESAQSLKKGFLLDVSLIEF